MFMGNKLHRYVMTWEHRAKSYVYLYSELSPSINQKKFAFLKTLIGIEKQH